MKNLLKIGFLASHRGSSMQAILNAISNGSLEAKAAVVISNNTDSIALSVARNQKIPAYHFSQQELGAAVDLDETILAALKDNDVNLIVLSGYLRKLGEKTLSFYEGRILNIHPSLLPKYGGQGMYGKRVHEAVIAAGDKISGASIHLVEDEYDTGRVIARQTVQVIDEDTPTSLASRIEKIEPEFFVNTLQRIISGDITLSELR